MTIERLHEIHSRRPFIPYTLHLADGSELPVKDRDFMSGGPKVRTIEVLHDGMLHYVDLLLVIKLTTTDEAK